MGLRGPQKTPTATLKLHGSRKIGNRGNEPKVKVSVPSCPRWLTGEGRKIWQRLIPQLKKAGVITKLDQFALARYCLYGILWMRELQNPGRTEATLERYANQLNRLEQSFGLTPSARASLSISPPAEKDPLEELMSRTNRRDA